MITLVWVLLHSIEKRSSGHTDFCTTHGKHFISFQIDRKRLLQPSLYPVAVVLRFAAEFGLATSSVLPGHGAREDRKDEERNRKNH